MPQLDTPWRSWQMLTLLNCWVGRNVCISPLCDVYLRLNNVVLYEPHWWVSLDVVLSAQDHLFVLIQSTCRC